MTQQQIAIESLHIDQCEIAFDQGAVFVDGDDLERAKWRVELRGAVWHQEPTACGQMVARIDDGHDLRGRIATGDMAGGAGSLLLRGLGPLQRG